MGADELDVVAVQQDAACIHALATRALDEVDLHDPAVALLAAWVAEIDGGVDETTRFVMPDPPSRGSASLVLPTARGRRSALIAGSTVLALVVSGGAAAAVTGDPLALVRAPLHAMAKVNPFGGVDSNARDELPNQTPDRANANKLLADARRAMADGDTATAQKLLTEATALLGGAANPGQQNRIDKLAGGLPGQSGSHQSSGHDPQGKGPGDKSNQGPKGPKGSNDPQGKGPGDKSNQGPKGSNDPQGKGPGDKSDQGPKGPNDPQGKGPGDKSNQGPKGSSTSKPSTGTSKGGSTKPRKGDTSGKASDSPSPKSTKAPKANPKTNPKTNPKG